MRLSAALFVLVVCVCVVRVYVWTDDHGRKLKCSAPLYFDYAMSYIQELLTDEDVFPTKAGKFVNVSFPASHSSFSAETLFLFSRFSVPDRLHLPRPESVFAIFPDSGSHLLVSLQRDPRVRPASASQYALLTPHTLLPAAWPVGARRNWAPAGPHHSFGTARLSFESKHTHIGPCHFHHPFIYWLWSYSVYLTM